MKLGSRSTRGQALVEYVLIIALISVIIVAVVKILGGYLMDSITKTSCSVKGADYEYVEGKKAGEGKCVDTNEEEMEEES